jgi:hypothetical protein
LKARRPQNCEASGQERIRFMAVVADIDQLSSAISHATAPAFMLGAVAGFLSILIARPKAALSSLR